MTLAVEPRHWIIISVAILLAGLAFWGLPQLWPVYSVSAYALPLIGAAAVLDTLGSASEGRKWP